jgi:hypothetical protein
MSFRSPLGLFMVSEIELGDNSDTKSRTARLLKFHILLLNDYLLSTHDDDASRTVNDKYKKGYSSTINVPLCQLVEQPAIPKSVPCLSTISKLCTQTVL